MLFERFISRERNEPPDIDVDFEHQRREEVMQYVYEQIRPRPRRAGRHAHHLPAEERGARRRQGAGPRSRAGRPADRRVRVVGRPQGRSGAHPRGRLRPGQSADRAARGARRRAAGLPAPPVAARRRLRHRARPARADGAGRERRDGRPHRHPVGQGRPRRAGPAQGRLPGARHALGDPPRAGDGLATPRQRIAHAGHSGRRPGGLRDVPARRHHRRVPDRIARAAVDAAAPASPRASTTSSSKSRSCARARSRAAWCIRISSGGRAWSRSPIPAPR